MNIYRSQIDDAAEVLEFSPTREQESVARVITIPDDAIAVAIGVGHLEEGGFARAKTVTLTVTQNGEPLRSEGAIADIEGNYVRAYMSNNPPRGEWMIRVSHKTARAFVVSVAVFRKPVKAFLSFANKHQCKACKVSLRALIFAVLAKLTAGAIAALDLKGMVAELLHLAVEVSEFLANTIGVSVDWLKDLFGTLEEIVGIETPWGWLARKICEKLGLCRAGASDD